ncbi:MAG: PDDEXK nuclease domain-containing protein [Bacteroidales bacterium]
MNDLKTEFVDEIKQILAHARNKAYSAANSAMVDAYWHIGKRIVEEEQQGEARAAYGERILQILSSELSSEFGKGFSYANLRNFRQFYLTYPNPEICYALCSKLTWSHNRLIMRVENENARNYYLKEASENQWSVRILERQINTFYYQRLMSSQSKNDAILQKTVAEKHQLHDFIKDPYVFEFLNIPQPITASEKEIETALIGNLQHFILELGKVSRSLRTSMM